jgi:dual specificity phosphatase 12
MSEIMPNLWLGCLDIIYDREFLKENGITHVLSVIEEDIVSPAMISAHVTHMHVRLPDLHDSPIVDYFQICNGFIEEALSSGGAVYVHCIMGMSRSPTIVAAYLMSKKGLSDKEAIAFIIARRPIVDPNDGFRGALSAFGKKAH